MPSIRVIITYFFPQVFGKSQDHDNSLHVGPPVSGGRVTQNLAGGIQHTSSYSIDYNSKGNVNKSKFVQLMDIGGLASSRSEFSVEDSVGREETESWRV